MVEAGFGELSRDLEVAVSIRAAGEDLAHVVDVDELGRRLEVDRVGQLGEHLPAQEPEPEQRVGRPCGVLGLRGPGERDLGVLRPDPPARS